MERKVFLVRNVAPEKYGGGEIYQLFLAEELKKNGFNPVILTNSEGLLSEAKKRKIETLQPPYIKRQNWSGWRNVLLPIYGLKQFKLEQWYKKIFEKYKPEVVNIQSRDEWIAVTKVAKKMGVRVLWTDHADFRNWVLWNVNNPLKNIIGKKIIELSKDAEKVIFVSKEVELETRRMIVPKKIKNSIVIENGVRDLFDEYEKVKMLNDSYIYIGRIVREKGISELIEAFELVNEKYPEIKLNIYGDGEDFEMYKKLASKNKRIVFHGRTDEPLEKMAENEIFVLPSYHEGLSLSLLDAAMMGKKIIASDVGGNSEVVINGETGLLVPARNAQKLTEAMSRMLENKKDAERMAENARRLYERDFDFEKIFKKKMLPLYNIKKEEK